MQKGHHLHRMLGSPPSVLVRSKTCALWFRIPFWFDCISWVFFLCCSTPGKLIGLETSIFFLNVACLLERIHGINFFFLQVYSMRYAGYQIAFLLYGENKPPASIFAKKSRWSNCRNHMIVTDDVRFRLQKCLAFAQVGVQCSWFCGPSCWASAFSSSCLWETDSQPWLWSTESSCYGLCFCGCLHWNRNPVPKEYRVGFGHKREVCCPPFCLFQANCGGRFFCVLLPDLCCQICLSAGKRSLSCLEQQVRIMLVDTGSNPFGELWPLLFAKWWEIQNKTRQISGNCQENIHSKSTFCVSGECIVWWISFSSSSMFCWDCSLASRESCSRSCSAHWCSPDWTDLCSWKASKILTRVRNCSQSNCLWVTTSFRCVSDSCPLWQNFVLFPQVSRLILECCG